MLSCKTCRHWTGTKYSQWADCSRVIAVLQPDLLKVKKYIDDDIWYYWKIPFDPHEVKYWNYNIDFLNRYGQITKSLSLPKSTKIEIVTERDIWMDQFGNERIKSVKVCYFMTHGETFNCKYFERRVNEEDKS